MKKLLLILFCISLSNFIIHEDSDISKLGIKDTYAMGRWCPDDCYAETAMPYNTMKNRFAVIKHYKEDFPDATFKEHWDYAEKKFGYNTAYFYFMDGARKR